MLNFWWQIPFGYFHRFSRIMTENVSFTSDYFTSTNEDSKTWVLLIKDDGLKLNDCNLPCIVKLRHPRSRTGSMYLFSSDNSTVHEILSFSENRSWFINDFVKKNGQFYFSTPIDPFFLILPYLKDSMTDGKIVPLEHLLIDDNYPETSRLLKLSALKNMSLLADKKGPEDLNIWAYNEEKTINWLSHKLEKVARILKLKNIISENINSEILEEINNDVKEKEFYLKYAHEIISEYIPEDLSLKLLLHLGLSEEPSEISYSNKRKIQEHNAESERKKIKTGEMVSLFNKQKSKGLITKKKENPTIARGMKSLTSFFKIK